MFFLDNKLYSAFERHWLLIKLNGLPMVWLVTIRLFGFVIGIAPGFIFHIIIILIKPLVFIRIYQIWCQRIGHFGLNTELYACSREFKIKTPESFHFDICYFGGIKSSNNQLSKMWRRTLRIWPKWLMEPTYFFLSNTEIGRKHIISGYHIDNGRDIFNLFERRSSPHIWFKNSELNKAKRTLMKYGLNENDKYVCLLLRDDQYLQKELPYRDHSYHNYRDSNIENYYQMCQYLVTAGYHVIRLGVHVKKKLQLEHPMIIDYATNGYRSDFMDIFLSSHCEFMVSTGTGIDSIADIFRRPIIYVNIAPIGLVPTYNKKTIFLPKKYFFVKENRFLSLKEIFEMGLGFSYRSEWFTNKGIQLFENTPEEIVATVTEYINRENGVYQYSESDEVLQNQFWKIFKKYAVENYYNKQTSEEKIHGEILSRISIDFLRSNSEYFLK